MTLEQPHDSIGLPDPQENQENWPAIDLCAEITAWSMASAPSPMLDASEILSFLIVGGIAGRSFNIERTGLNQYWHLVALSGTGKGIIIKCFGRLFAEIGESVKAALELKGPGNLASGPGMITWLADRPYPIAVCVFDEWGSDIDDMANPRSPNGRAKEKTLNQLWPLSGAGNVLDGKAHADSGKNVGTLESPALTIAGTGTPERFNEVLASSLSNSGLFSRIMIVEHVGDIPPLNEHHQYNFEALPPRIVQGLSDLASTALTHAHSRRVQPVALTEDASGRFKAYAEDLRQRRNAMGDGPARELSNRNREKALKLAGTIAVGQNWHFPLVTLPVAEWAINYVEHYTNLQASKFGNGEVGETAGNQTLQEREIKRVIADYLSKPWDECGKYHGTEAMHRAMVITQAHIAQRVYVRKAFAKDPRGPKDALTRTLKSLLEADIIREMPHAQMAKDFGKHPRAFAVSDPDAIIKEMKL